jgi:hypothetical protein
VRKLHAAGNIGGAPTDLEGYLPKPRDVSSCGIDEARTTDNLLVSTQKAKLIFVTWALAGVVARSTRPPRYVEWGASILVSPAVG